MMIMEPAWCPAVLAMARAAAARTGDNPVGTIQSRPHQAPAGARCPVGPRVWRYAMRALAVAHASMPSRAAFARWLRGGGARPCSAHGDLCHGRSASMKSLCFFLARAAPARARAKPDAPRRANAELAPHRREDDAIVRYAIARAAGDPAHPVRIGEAISAMASPNGEDALTGPSVPLNHLPHGRAMGGPCGEEEVDRTLPHPGLVGAPKHAAAHPCVHATSLPRACHMYTPTHFSATASRSRTSAPTMLPMQRPVRQFATAVPAVSAEAPGLMLLDWLKVRVCTELHMHGPP